MKCKECGSKLNEKDLVCPTCGTKPNHKMVDEVAALAKRIQEGDSEAFNEFFEKTQKYVRYVAKQITGNIDVAEDVLQEVFISVYKNIGSLKNTQAAFAWLKTITRNEAFKHVEKESKYELESDNEDEKASKLEIAETDTMKLPEDVAINEERRRVLREMVDELPDNQRIAFFCTYYEQMKSREIAEAFGIPEGTVKVSLKRAKAAMQEKINAYSEKTGTKLYSMPLLPIFFLLFSDAIQCEAATAMPKAVVSVAAAAKTTEAAATGVKGVWSAIKSKIAASAAAKTTIGVVGAVVIGIGTIGASNLNTKEKDKPVEEIVETAIVEKENNIVVDTEVQDIQDAAEVFAEALCDLDEEKLKSMILNGGDINCFEILSRLNETGKYITSPYHFSDLFERDIQNEMPSEFEILDIKYESITAVIHVKLKYADGNEKEGYLTFVKSDSGWAYRMPVCAAQYMEKMEDTERLSRSLLELLENFEPNENVSRAITYPLFIDGVSKEEFELWNKGTLHTDECDEIRIVFPRRDVITNGDEYIFPYKYIITKNGEEILTQKGEITALRYENTLEFIKMDTYFPYEVKIFDLLYMDLYDNASLEKKWYELE